MAVDINEIYERFKIALNVLVGDSLAQIPASPSNVSTIPAIFKSKDKYPGGFYPLIGIDVGNRVKQSDPNLYEYYDNTGATTLVVTYDYFVTINFHGRQGDNIQQIADDAEAGFARRDILEIFNNDSFGEISETFDVIPIFTKKGDEVREFASFIVKFSTNNLITYSEPEITSTTVGLHFNYPDSDESIIVRSIQEP